jgi:aminoglycoside 3-N-acetyltransferase
MIPNPAAPGIVTRADLLAAFAGLGLGAGDVVLVHASLSSFGHVAGGAHSVVEALLAAVSDQGTVVVPTFTAGNADPRRWARTRGWEVPAQQWPLIRERLPPFDPLGTPSENMGVIAETVRTWPGAVRSAHPQTSFAAVGRDAALLMGEHPQDCHLGPGTPLARLVEHGSKVLLLGVPYRVCTAFHLGEYWQPAPPPRDYECVIQDHGVRRWFHYRDVLLDDRDFEQLGQDLETSGEVEVRRTEVGAAVLRLAPLGGCVDFARSWLAAHRERP